MANLTQTAANVGVQSSATLLVVQVGEAVTQGMPAYLSAPKYYKADASALVTAAAVGIFLTAASGDGEYAVLATTGDINLGATLAVGETYVVSATAGAIAPIGDLTTGDYVTHLGVAIAADTLRMDINASGALVPA